MWKKSHDRAHGEKIRLRWQDPVVRARYLAARTPEWKATHMAIMRAARAKAKALRESKA